MSSWLAMHAHALRRALRKLGAAPLASFLAFCVIGIVITLPAAGWLLVDNLGRLTRDVAGGQQISIFMRVGASAAAAAAIEPRLEADAATAGKWRFVPRQAALQRLEKEAGLAGIGAGLPDNPLPDAFIVEPADTAPAALAALAASFAAWPEVAHVQLDAAWAERLHAILGLGRLMAGMLSLVFAAALAGVIFNTIRLQILAQTAEIEVARLIGATNAWVSRPFLYFGAIEGGGGALLAAAFIALATHFLQAPVSSLAALYASGFSLRGPGLGEVVALCASGALLGLSAARAALYLHLRRVD